MSVVFAFVALVYQFFLVPSHGDVRDASSFHDDFEGHALDSTKWETTTWLGGFNGEFHYYTDGENVHVSNGRLQIRPDLTSNFVPGGHAEAIGWKGVLGCGREHPSELKRPTKCQSNESFTISLPHCDSTDLTMCTKSSGQCVLFDKKNCASFTTLPPVTSGLIRTKRSFQYGQLEIRARLPRGDWLWPAIWLLPEKDTFGGWPVSGEIDIMESRGNERNACGPMQGRDAFGSTLHFGPDPKHNGFKHAHTEASNGTDLSEDFHVYGLYFSEDRLYTYIDDPSNKVLSLDFREKDFWTRGGSWEWECLTRTFEGKCTSYLPRPPAWRSSEKLMNPYVNGTNATPFDQAFFLQINLAIGGCGPYFPDHLCRGKVSLSTDCKRANDDKKTTSLTLKTRTAMEEQRAKPPILVYLRVRRLVAYLGRKY